MVRSDFLKQVISLEDRIQAIYNGAARHIKQLPIAPASRAEARATLEDADKRVRELIFSNIRKGAEGGDERAILEVLREMKRRWRI